MKKTLKFATIVAALALIAGVKANAMTEAWSASNNRFLTLADTSTPVPVGDYIAIGIDSNPSATVTAAQNVGPAAAGATLTIWGSSAVGAGSNPEGAFVVTTISPGAGFFSQQIYLLAYNNANPALATQVGVFTNPAWVFPASDGAAGGSLDLSDPGTSAVFGSLHTGTINDPDLGAPPALDAASLAVSPVPEPSSLVLVGLGLLGGLGVIRRRK